MKINSLLLAGAVFCGLFGGAYSALSQSTAFNYQGNLMIGGTAANGAFDLEFALFNAPTSGVQSGPTLTNLGVSVDNGLFTVTLDFLDEANYSLFSQQFWLQIGVRTNGGTNFTLLSPRQEILGVPYAFYAVTAGTAVSATSADTVGPGGVNTAAIQAGAVTSPAIAANAVMAVNIAAAQVVKSLNFLHDNITLVPGNNVTINQNGQTLTIAANAGWSLTGNAGTTPGTDFLGTTDNQSLELHVNGTRALLLQPVFNAPNVVAGSSNNHMGTFANGGNTIAGGGSNYIGGGSDTYAFIGAGFGNNVGSLFNSSSYEAIVAGKFNTNYGLGSSIVGGALNNIQDGSGWSFIGGGSNNAIQENTGGFHVGNSFSSIVGGVGNMIQSKIGMVFIGGGEGNIVQTYSNDHGLDGTPGDMCSSIVGGFGNTIQSDTDGAFIGGGSNNVIQSALFPYDAVCTTIGGGGANTDAASFSLIGGGHGNTMGFFADNSAIGAGEANNILNYAGWSFIGGGVSNLIQGSGEEEFAPGKIYSSIVGGVNNSILTNSPLGIIGGGYYNSILANTEASVIAGGEYNTNGSYGGSVIAGGVDNSITNYQAAFATIGGGTENSANGLYATVPGGADNSAQGTGSFAAGVSAKALGDYSFVWSSGVGGPVTSTAGNVFVIGGVDGVGINKTNPAFPLDVNGTINATGSIYINYSNGSPAITLSPNGTISTIGNLDASNIVADGITTYGNLFAYSIGVGQGLNGPDIYLNSDGSIDAGGQISASCFNGVFCSASDRNLKENFTPIDSREILDRIVSLPITRWDYKSDAETSHLGPMAQDFYSAFHVGKDDKHITTVDEDGVALAAIQGLNSKVEEVAKDKDAEINTLKAANQALEKRLNDLEKIVARLSANQPSRDP